MCNRVVLLSDGIDVDVDSRKVGLLGIAANIHSMGAGWRGEGKGREM